MALCGGRSRTSRAAGRPKQSLAKLVRYALDAIFAHRDIRGIVLGLPLNMDGSRGPMVEAAESFAAALERATGLEPATFSLEN